MRFWEGRRDTPQTAECSPARAVADAATQSQPQPPDPNSASAIARRMLGGETHPVHEVRIEKLKAELARWETLRVEARAERDRLAKKAAAAAVAEAATAQS